MAHQAQKSLVLREVTAAEILPFVAGAAAFAVDVDSSAAARVARAGRSFIVSADGADLLGYTLQEIGGALEITAAAGRADFDLVQLLAQMVEIQAQGMQQIKFKTTRRGLVKKAQKQGYEIAAYIMRKKLQ